MSVYGKFYFGDSDLPDVIRNLEYIDNIVPSVANLDKYESTEISVVIFLNDDQPVAFGKLLYIDNIYLIKTIIGVNVDENLQYRELAVRMLVNKAFLLGAKEVYSATFNDNEIQDVYLRIGFTRSMDEFLYNGVRYSKYSINEDNFYKECSK